MSFCKNVTEQGNAMRAKLTSKNQMTFPTRKHETVNTNQLSVVREKMEALGISEKDVQEAVTGSRKRK